jgi:hypothetical protein
MSHFIHLLSHATTEPVTPPVELIHMLDHDCKPLCGVDMKAMKRAWTICAWPADAALWPDLCQSCWHEAHTPVVPLRPGLQLVKTRPAWSPVER